MKFEVEIKGNEVWVMRAAGVEMCAYQELFDRVLTERAKLPAVVTCAYFLSDEPMDVQITVLAFGHMKIEVADEVIAKKIQAEVLRYASENRSQMIADAEHNALRARMDEILKPDGVTPGDVEADTTTLSRREQEALMQLCTQTHHAHRGQVYWKFIRRRIPKEDRVFVARWLLQRFAVEKDPNVRSDIDSVFLN